MTLGWQLGGAADWKWGGGLHSRSPTPAWPRVGFGAECLPVDTALGLHFSLSRCLLPRKHSSGHRHSLFPHCSGENQFKPLHLSWVAG